MVDAYRPPDGDMPSAGSGSIPVQDSVPDTNLRPSTPIGGSIGWQSRMVKGDRYGWDAGGPYSRIPQLGVGGGAYPAASYSQYVADREAVGEQQISEGALDALGKTKITIPSATKFTGELPEELVPPERSPGFAEGMLGGIVEAFTGALPGYLRDPLRGAAQGAGQLLDIPLGVFGNVPINELFGLENVETAFRMLPMTADKRRIMDSIAREPTEANWFMAQYLRAHATDYATMKGLPQVFANVIRPDATLIERALGLLNVPSQAISRTVAGVFGRAQEVIDNPDIGAFNPQLGLIRERYMAGEYGPVGSQEALDRMTDEIVSVGAGWSDDPFVGTLAEMITDPLIWAGMGTGLALKAVRVGSLTRQASAMGRIARGSTDNLVQQAVRQADDIIAAQAQSRGRMGLKTAGESYEWGQQFRKFAGQQGKDIARQATDELGAVDQAQIFMRKPIEVAARAAELANDPFKLFGVGKVSRLISSRFHRNSATGFFNAHGIGTVAKVYKAVPEQLRTGLDEAVGAALAYRTHSLVAGNLTRHLRSNMRDIDTGKPMGMHVLPDTLDDPDAAVRAARDEGNPLEAQQLEGFVRRTKTDYIPDLGSLEGEARIREYDRQMGLWTEQAVQKLAHAARIDVAKAREILKNADADMLGWVDEVHWGRTLLDAKEAKALDREVVRRILRREQQQISSPTGLEDAERLFDIVNRATLVGPRELTKDQAADYLTRLHAATTIEDKVAIVNEAMAAKEYLYQNLYEKTRITKDDDLVKRFELMLKDGLDNDRFVTVVSAAELPDNLRMLRDSLRSRGTDYEVGLAPARDKRWRPIMDPDNGQVIGYSPWVDIDIDPMNVKGPGRMTIARERLATPIRGETVLVESRRKFIRTGVRKYQLNRGEAHAVWEAVMGSARDKRISARGFAPEEFREIVRNVNISDAARQSLGARGLAELTARALEGDLRHVGLTTKISGKAKAFSASKMDNWLGYLAERIYPFIRFRGNFIFMAQEFIEPYFFNILRGVKPGFQWSLENLDMHTLLDEWNMAERLADGMESREFMMIGAFRARQGMGPNTRAADILDQLEVGEIQKRKRLNYYNTVSGLFGDYLHAAFQREFPGRWVELEAFYNQLDKAQGGRGLLTRGQVAARYMKHKGLYDPDTSYTQTLHFDGAAPDQFGNIRGIRTSYLAKSLGFDSGTQLRRAALDPMNPLNEDLFKETLIERGFTPEYSARAWAVTTGVTPDELRASIANGYADTAVGAAAADASMQVLQVMATSKMLSLDEYVARKFATPSVWLGANARLPYNAMPQFIRDAFEEYGFGYVEYTDARVIEATRLAVDMRPTEMSADLSTHLKVHQRVIEDGSKAVPEGQGRVVGRRKVGDITIDLDSTPEEMKEWAISALGGQAQMVGAGNWYHELSAMFVSFVENLNEETLDGYARLMNENMKTVADIDLTDRGVLKAQIAARMLMAFSTTQIMTSPVMGFGFILKMMDREVLAGGLNGRIPKTGGISDSIKETQLFRMLRDFDTNVSTSGMGVKIHDFTDGCLGLKERTFMRNLRDGGMHDYRQPVAGDVWAMRAVGIIDGPMVNYLTRYLMRQTPSLKSEKVARKQVLDSLGLTEDGLRTEGRPTPEQYEFITQKYNDTAAQWNSEKWLFDERGGREWLASEVQAVDWMRIQQALGMHPDSQYSMIGDNVVDVAFDFDPERSLPIRQMYGDSLAQLTPDQRDYVSRNIAYDVAAIVQEEAGVTILRKQPGWGNHEGIVSANTTYSMVGTAEAIDNALDTISLLTQATTVYATTAPGKLPQGYKNSVKAKRFWGIDFAPRDPAMADVRTLEALRMWLTEEVDAGRLQWEGSMNAMRPGTLGSSLRSVYQTVGDGLDMDGFTRERPIDPQTAAALADGSWSESVLGERVPVDTERILHNLRSRVNDYTKDEAKANKRIKKGEDSKVVYAEEMGRKVMAGMTKRGADESRGRVVGRHMDAIRATAGESIKHASDKAESVGRGRLGLREVGDIGDDGPNATRTQYSPRGWRGATAFDRRRATTESVARGNLSGRRGAISLKTGKADVTTPIHEVFHLFADDLDPSAIKSIHAAWFDSLTPAQKARFPGMKHPDDWAPEGHNFIIRDAEEWVAHQFEEWTATGIAPSFDATLNAVFQTYARYWDAMNPGKTAGAALDPTVQGLFDGLVPDKHRGPAATFNVNEYRLLEAARIALQRAEEEAFKVHYYKRGRNWLERSINHPYMGMYPASYMWGKVLPEMLRFLVKKPFGVDAPFAGLAMANHVYEAIQLDLNTDDGEFADLVKRFPEALRFLQLMVPGTPWDIPVNAPAWTRRLVQSGWKQEDPDLGGAISDTLAYAYAPGRVPNDIMEFFGQTFGFAQGAARIATGQYETQKEQEERETEERALQMRGAMPPPVVEPRHLVPSAPFG